MTKSTNDLNNRSHEEDSTTIGEKYLVSRENLQFLEEIAQGKFCTGRNEIGSIKERMLVSSSVSSSLSNSTQWNRKGNTQENPRNELLLSLVHCCSEKIPFPGNPSRPINLSPYQTSTYHSFHWYDHPYRSKHDVGRLIKEVSLNRKPNDQWI